MRADDGGTSTMMCGMMRMSIALENTPLISQIQLTTRASAGAQRRLRMDPIPTANR